MTSRRRIAVAAVALSLATGVAHAADQPPRNLHKVGDHWTAWTPPETPPGMQVHIIEPGDTLWALAGRFYGNPYLWPQLWERNQYILDAHWIYPGDPLVIGPEGAAVEELAEEDLGGGDGTGADATGTAEDAAMGLDISVAPPEPLGSEDDIYCSGYIGEVGEEFGYRVVGSEYSSMSPTLGGGGGMYSGAGVLGELETVKYTLSLGDIVYVDGGLSAGLAPGLLYTVVKPRELVHHPVTSEVVGQLYQYQGRLRLLTVNDTVAIAEIVQACDAILVGDGLKPFVPEPVPLGRRTGVRPSNAPVDQSELADDSVILRAKDKLTSLAADHVVFISMGADKGVVPGDVYTVYRRNRQGFPPVVLGELAVLSVQPRASVARIIESRYTIYVGDHLEPK